MSAPWRVAFSVVLALALALVLAGAASAAQFSVGAARTDTTPRLQSAALDAAQYPSCPAAVYTGRRTYEDQEPYVDVNGNGVYDDGEPYCDANLNGRYDQMWTSGATIGNPRVAGPPHDPLDARAIAISDGLHVDVIVSVVAQGLFNTYIDRMIARAKQLDPAITDMVVSANHNESSPDTVGIYGGPSPSVTLPAPIGIQGSPAPLRSGIDDHYMDFLVEQVAHAAASAASHLHPGTLWARQFLVPAGLKINLSDNWPTTDNSVNRPTATDPKIGVLQARSSDGTPIFTVMSLAAHNQEIGHSGASALSSDWPGYFHAALQAKVPGMAMFLVGDNGSQEDPQTQPPLSSAGADAGTYAQAQATGDALASAVAAEAPSAQPLRDGALRYQRADFCVPLENNLFKAAAGAGLFGQRQTYLYDGGACKPTGAQAPGGGTTVTGAPDGLKTTVSTLDVGPDLQLVANPGESFPALVLGSPWGKEDVPTECQDRANPPAPTWRSHAEFRLQVGLANDFIGYEIPPWAYIGSYGTFTVPSDPSCQAGSPGNPTDSTDSKGHHHKLETEGVGPTASAQVASQLNALEGSDAPDPSAHVVSGRFVAPNGSYSRSGQGAAGILIPGGGVSALDPTAGTLIGDSSTGGFGGRAVDTTGVFMDYDGQPQASPDVTTRGMLVLDGRGCVAARYYLDVFPTLDTSRHLGARVAQPVALPSGSCSTQGTGTPGQGTGAPGQQLGVPGIQAGAAGAAHLPVPGPGGRTRGCIDRIAPRAVTSRRALLVRHGRLQVGGRASDRTCANRVARVARVVVRIARSAGGHCRFVKPSGRLTGPRSCARPVLLLTRGTSRWSLRLRLHVPAGTYKLLVQAVDPAGNVQPLRRAGQERLRMVAASTRRRARPRDPDRDGDVDRRGQA